MSFHSPNLHIEYESKSPGSRGANAGRPAMTDKPKPNNRRGRMTKVYVYDQDNDPHRFCDIGLIEVTTYEDRALGRRSYIDHRCEECKLIAALEEEIA